MEFVRRNIVNGETIIDKELLDAFQDGIIEGIEKAEAALAVEPVVYNASTHYDFPSVGRVDVIYKAESEKLLYQWNVDELKYDVLCESNTSVDVSDIKLINGGNAYGTD